MAVQLHVGRCACHLSRRQCTAACGEPAAGSAGRGRRRGCAPAHPPPPSSAGAAAGGPPAVLHQPRLAHRLDRPAVDHTGVRPPRPPAHAQVGAGSGPGSRSSREGSQHNPSLGHARLGVDAQRAQRRFGPGHGAHLGDGLAQARQARRATGLAAACPARPSGGPKRSTASATPRPAPAAKPGAGTAPGACAGHPRAPGGTPPARARSRLPPGARRGAPRAACARAAPAAPAAGRRARPALAPRPARSSTPPAPATPPGDPRPCACAAACPRRRPGDGRGRPPRRSDRRARAGPPKSTQLAQRAHAESLQRLHQRGGLPRKRSSSTGWEAR